MVTSFGHAPSDIVSDGVEIWRNGSMRPLERGLGSKHAVTPDSAQGVLHSRDGRRNDGGHHARGRYYDASQYGRPPPSGRSHAVSDHCDAVRLRGFTFRHVFGQPCDVSPVFSPMRVHPFLQCGNPPTRSVIVRRVFHDFDIDRASLPGMYGLTPEWSLIENYTRVFNPVRDFISWGLAPDRTPTQYPGQGSIWTQGAFRTDYRARAVEFEPTRPLLRSGAFDRSATPSLHRTRYPAERIKDNRFISAGNFARLCQPPAWRAVPRPPAAV